MAEPRNPYAPPTAPVADPGEQMPGDDGQARFIPDGRSVSIGRGAGWLTDSWQLFRGRPGKWLGGLLILFVLYIVVSIIPLVNFFAGFLWPILNAGIMVAAERQRRSGNFDLDNLFDGFRKPLPLLGLSLVVILAVVVLAVVAVLAMGTDVLAQFIQKRGTGAPPQISSGAWVVLILVYCFVVLPLSATTWLAPPLIMIQGLPVFTAMRMSLFGAIKNILPGIVYIICSIVLVLVSIIPIGLGLFITLPMMMLSTYTVYRDIFFEAEGA